MSSDPDDVFKTWIRKNLNRFMRELTDNGNLDFEAMPYQNLKTEVEKEERIDVIAEILLETASESGCIDRFSILQLINDFFLQSTSFRNILLNDPTEFSEIMLETNLIRKPLPGSKTDGERLKAQTILIVKNWEQKYAKHDARMKCFVVTLKKTKFVDYEFGDKKIEEEKSRRVMIERRKQMMIDRTLSVFKSKFEEIKEETERLSMELTTTMNMLVPSFTDSEDLSSIPTTSTKSPKTMEIIIEDLSPMIQVSQKNDAIVEAFLGSKLMLTHRVQTLRKLAKRLQTLKEPGEELAQNIINYRDGLKKLVLKADELKINKKVEKKKKFDDDFVDVEISIDDILMVQYAQKDEEIEEKPKDIVAKVEKKEKPKIKSVPFGLDLKYWGEERKDVQVPKNNSDCHRFWRSSEEGSGTVHNSIYTQRQFTFIGEAPKIDRECLAKLPNGSLCKRMDMKVCPLHGLIVPRDNEGVPLNEEDRIREAKRIEKRRLKEAEEYSKKIEKEYESANKRRKKHEVKTSASTDIRNRLQKKLFDRQTIERVSADITSSRRNRLEKNFSHQFSHL
uniref:UV-stimulated scaffold protein A n=1 Tax=Caenorhabditis tropicalis TaxID=1561998 RepID=A0A1I7UQG9_9PELO